MNKGFPGGPGTVRICTTEPDTAIVAVRINGAPAAACATVNAGEGGTLDIDFIAHDPDGHLAYYSLGETAGQIAMPRPSRLTVSILPTMPISIAT